MGQVAQLVKSHACRNSARTQINIAQLGEVFTVLKSALRSAVHLLLLSVVECHHAQNLFPQILDKNIPIDGKCQNGLSSHLQDVVEFVVQNVAPHNLNN